MTAVAFWHLSLAVVAVLLGESTIKVAKRMQHEQPWPAALVALLGFCCVLGGVGLALVALAPLDLTVDLGRWYGDLVRSVGR